MKLSSLNIRRKASYESGPELKASADFEGPGGSMTVELDSGFIIKVLSLIEQDAATRAKSLAASVASAMTDSINDTMLLEIDKPLSIGGNV